MKHRGDTLISSGCCLRRAVVCIDIAPALIALHQAGNHPLEARMGVKGMSTEAISRDEMVSMLDRVLRALGDQPVVAQLNLDRRVVRTDEANSSLDGCLESEFDGLAYGHAGFALGEPNLE